MKEDTVKIVGVVFVIQKLTGLIDWSWWWVLSPYWIYMVIILLEVQLGIGKHGTRRGDK